MVRPTAVGTLGHSLNGRRHDRHSSWPSVRQRFDTYKMAENRDEEKQHFLYDWDSQHDEDR